MYQLSEGRQYSICVTREEQPDFIGDRWSYMEVRGGREDIYLTEGYLDPLLGVRSAQISRECFTDGVLPNFMCLTVQHNF